MEGFSREQASVKRVLLLYLLFSWSSKGDFASLLPASGGSNSPNSSNLTPYRRAELSQLSWSAAHVVYLGFLKEDGCLDSNLIAEGEEVGSEDDENVSIDANNEKTWQEYGGEKGSAESLKPEGYNFDTCPPEMRDYIPCLDNVAAIKSLQSTAKGEKWERHCPQGKSRLCCLIPAPKGYKSPIRWPKSRDEVWYNNVPHTRLVADKGGQNWIAIAKDKFKFPGGGTQFAHGADQYLDQMSQMLPDLKFGTHVRVALDIGCGVASWGAYLLARGVLTLSIAPKDVHENQIQFALERGIPAMIAVLATHRLLYPSQAFDLIHCSRCRIEWTRDDGVLLLEVDRVLKAGGYFAWAAQPVYKHEESNQRTWLDMEDLATRMCWKLVAKQGYIAIWQKPIDKSCYSNRLPGALPTLCDINEDPDSVWYVTLKACITLPRNNPDKFFWLDYPARLDNPPVRLQSLHIDAIASKNEVFEADRRYWIEIVQGYLRGLSLKIEDIRNVMDMRACYGG
ncbi:hypothetical protein O6H91_22G069400 [Diphasiastrum complanatum]|nr:hypothetical protein O6H91_22G069400 [Diphasiastrum complanatum]